MDISIFDVIRTRSWDQLRALLYVVVPLAIAATVETHTWEWTGLALAILTPSLASWKSVTGFRTALQGVIAALQVLLVAMHLVTDAQFTTWAQIVLAIVGGGVAAANVHAKRTDQSIVIDQDGNPKSGPVR
uniref:Holin n=1 Tax=Mycobacterium phage Farewell TaxID=3158893 RepID=A0AAU8GNV6_9CAUD